MVVINKYFLVNIFLTITAVCVVLKWYTQSLKKNITMVHNLQFLYQDNAIKINSEAK